MSSVQIEGNRKTTTVAWLAPLAWIGLLAVLLAGLHRAGAVLAPPPAASLDALRTWLESNDPTTAALAIVRLGALAVGWYLMAVSLVGLFVRLAGLRRMVRVADLFTIRPVRRLLSTIAGAGLATSALLLPAAVPGGVAAVAAAEEPLEAPEPAPPADPAEDPEPTTPPSPTEEESDTATMRQVDDGPVAVMRQLPPGLGEPSTTTTSLPPTPAPITPEEPAPGPAAAPTQSEGTIPERATWEVEPGDHLWSIAERTLAEAWGREPTDREITRYWSTLIDHNRQALVDPDNPDLIHPGQVFELPAVP